MLRELRADMARYRGTGGWPGSLGFWVGATQRVGAAMYRVRPTPLRLSLLAGYKAVALPFQMFRKVEIPARTPVGEGLYLPNPYGIIMPHTVEIGPACTIHPGVTLGLGPVPGVPRLGRGVVLMPGAKVLGGVTLGDGVVVETNAVVTKDVPDGVTIASPVSRVRSRG